MKRIRLSRAKGWRKPENTVVVARPTKWGNPFDWRELGRATAKRYYQSWLNDQLPIAELEEQRQWILDHIHELRGKNLACWCNPEQPCHADVLLEMANQ